MDGTAAPNDRAFPGATDSATVTISFPADPRWVRTVRLATTGVASVGPFDLEAVDDLRIAVNELCGILVGIEPGGRVQLDLRCDGAGFGASGEIPIGATPIDRDRFVLGLQILSVMSDEHGLDIGDGYARCWFRRSIESAAEVGDDAGVG